MVTSYPSQRGSSDSSGLHQGQTFCLTGFAQTAAPRDARQEQVQQHSPAFPSCQPRSSRAGTLSSLPGADLPSHRSCLLPAHLSGTIKLFQPKSVAARHAAFQSLLPSRACLQIQQLLLSQVTAINSSCSQGQLQLWQEWLRPPTSSFQSLCWAPTACPT